MPEVRWANDALEPDDQAVCEVPGKLFEMTIDRWFWFLLGTLFGFGLEFASILALVWTVLRKEKDG